jgi:hypothetical protein
MTHRIPCLLGWTYKSDLVLNSRVVRFRSLNQALEKAELELEATPNFIPTIACVTAMKKIISCAKPLMMVLHGV